MSRKMGSQPQWHNSSMVIPLGILLLSVCALSFICSSPLAHSRELISLEAEIAGPSTQQQDNAVNAFVEGKQLAAQGTAGSLRAAAEKFKQAAELFRAAGNRQAEGASLTMLASVETALSENQRAFEHLTQALPLLQAAGDRSGEANALANLGVVSDNLGEKQKALEYYKQALPVLRDINDRQSEATVLSNIGKVLLDLGELEQALEYFNQALPLRRAAKDSAGEAATLVNLGNAYSALGDKTKALDYYNQALPLLRAAGERRLEAITLSNIGLVHDSFGEKQKALDYFEQALAIQRAAGDRTGEGTTLNNIGLVDGSQGEKQRALDYYNRALVIARAVGDRRTEAITLSNIGEFYYSVGENQKALDYYNQAVTLKRAIGDRASEATTLNNIGGVFQRLGERPQALNYYNQALTIQRAVGDQSGQATVLNNIGDLYWELGENQKAIDSLNQALTLRRAVGDRSGEAVTLNNIALVYDRLGEKTRALGFHEQALALEQAVADRSGEALTLFNIAGIERDRDHLREGRARIEAALNIIESLRTKITSKELRASYFASVQSYYEFYINLLMRLHKQNPAEGVDAIALQAVERGRARSLLETLAEAHADIRQGVNPQLLERERSVQGQLNAGAQAQMKMLSGKHTEDQARTIAREVEALTTELQQVEAEIRQKSPNYAALTQPQPLSLNEIQTKVLDADTLLLEYSVGEERSYLWAVSPNSITSYELPKRSEIEPVARRVYDLLTARNKRVKGETTEQWQARAAQADSEIPEAAAGLSRMVLAPVAAQLGKKRLVIVADGVLQYIPFGALPVVTGQSSGVNPDTYQPLVVDHELVSLPSASTLDVIRRDVAGRQPAPKAVVALADPVFTKNDERVKSNRTGEAVRETSRPESIKELELVEAAEDTGITNGELKVPRLAGSRKEAEEIVAMVPVAERKLALDFAASRETATSADLSQYRYVHFSTHGFLDSVHPELSGIVFSLVNERGEAQDGFLRAHEVFNLKLPADLVVLSACQTGIGKEIKGEGLVSLTRGFMYAGAPRVVVSLWSVSEMGTTELMVRFYREMLKEGKTPAAALRAAQISLMKEKRWASPFYWAPFTLQGEWR